MSSLVQVSIYVFTALITVGVGIARIRSTDLATRILLLLLLVSVTTEIIALYCARTYHYNLQVYRIYNTLEILAYVLYFNYSVSTLKRCRAGWIIGVAGAVWSLVAGHMYPEDVDGTHFLVVEGVVILCLCMYAVFTMLLAEETISPVHNIHFWIVAGITFNWSLSHFSIVMLSVVRKPFMLPLRVLVLTGHIGMLLFICGALILIPKPKWWNNNELYSL